MSHHESADLGVSCPTTGCLHKGKTLSQAKSNSCPRVILSVLQFLFTAQKPWLMAYNELDATDRPSSQRPRGQPLIFIPGDTDGDLITSKVIDYSVILPQFIKSTTRGSAHQALRWNVFSLNNSGVFFLHFARGYRLMDSRSSSRYTRRIGVALAEKDW